MPRQFFVGGNFKMWELLFTFSPPTKQKGFQLTFALIRNGSVDSIKKIVGNLNDAKLDPNTGMYLPWFIFVHLLGMKGDLLILHTPLSSFYTAFWDLANNLFNQRLSLLHLLFTFSLPASTWDLDLRLQHKTFSTSQMELSLVKSPLSNSRTATLPGHFSDTLSVVSFSKKMIHS